MTEMTTLDQHPFADSGPARERRPARVSPLSQGAMGNLDWRQALGGAFVVAGVVAVLVGWYGVSGTLDPGKQMPYLVSGGIGGAALIAMGMISFLSLEHARDRAALGDVLDRLDSVEGRLDRLNNGSAEGAEPQAANGRRAARTASPPSERGPR